MTNILPFYIKDCALATIATGLKARTLMEFREKLSAIDPACVYYHFWSPRLRPSFEHWLYLNDFSQWFRKSLHDDVLAERVDVLDPTDYVNMEDLRDDLLKIVDHRLHENEALASYQSAEEFYFAKSKIIIFQTRLRFSQPAELVHIVPLLTLSSLFFHFIDARRRTSDKIDDFSSWLKDSFGDEYQDLISMLRKKDPYIISLSDLKIKLIKMITQYFVKDNA